MPRYRARHHLLLGKLLIEPGHEFESDLVPGRHWEPLDDDARAAVAQRDLDRAAHQAQLDAETERVAPAKAERPDPSTIEIPEGWLELRGEKIVNLARRLGARGNCTMTQAIVHIETVLRERAAQDELKGAA